MTTGIYCIHNKINDRRYIGQAKNAELRMRGHLNWLRKGIHGNNHLQSSFSKYGEENFEFYILEKCSSNKKVLTKNEQKWMDEFRPNLYNQTPSAASCLGIKRPDVSKRMKGITLPKEWRRHISLGQLGNKRGPHSKEAKERMSLAQTGILKPGTSKALTGRKRPDLSLAIKQAWARKKDQKNNG